MITNVGLDFAGVNEAIPIQAAPLPPSIFPQSLESFARPALEESSPLDNEITNLKNQIETLKNEVKELKTAEDFFCRIRLTDVVIGVALIVTGVAMLVGVVSGVAVMLYIAAHLGAISYHTPVSIANKIVNLTVGSGFLGVGGSALGVTSIAAGIWCKLRGTHVDKLKTEHSKTKEFIDKHVKNNNEIYLPNVLSEINDQLSLKNEKIKNVEQKIQILSANKMKAILLNNPEQVSAQKNEIPLLDKKILDLTDKIKELKKSKEFFSRIRLKDILIGTGLIALGVVGSVGAIIGSVFMGLLLGAMSALDSDYSPVSNFAIIMGLIFLGDIEAVLIASIGLGIAWLLTRNNVDTINTDHDLTNELISTHATNGRIRLPDVISDISDQIAELEKERSTLMAFKFNLTQALPQAFAQVENGDFSDLISLIQGMLVEDNTILEQT